MITRLVYYLDVLVFLERLSRQLLTDYIIVWWHQKVIKKGNQGINDVTNVWNVHTREINFEMTVCLSLHEHGLFISTT